jgi:hypothetical protein
LALSTGSGVEACIRVEPQPAFDLYVMAATYSCYINPKVRRRRELSRIAVQEVMDNIRTTPLIYYGRKGCVDSK